MHGGAPCCAFPLARLAGEGDKGVRAKGRACPFTLTLGETVPASEIPYRAAVIRIPVARSEFMDCPPP